MRLGQGQMIEGDSVLNGRYAVLSHVQVSIGSARLELGQRGSCRFCRNDGVSFRHKAHLMPEALGNRWAFSLDECDSCNAKFSVYESALADAVAPLVTLGGIRGKSNKIRQTGRTKGGAILSRNVADSVNQISAVARGVDMTRVAAWSPTERRLCLRIPVPGVPFSPRRAYKALCRMAYALLPATELSHYEVQRTWLLDPNEAEAVAPLDVALSTGSVGNAPPLATATLLRRSASEECIPELLFFFCAGEVLEAFWPAEIVGEKPGLAPTLLIYADLLATGDTRRIETAKLIYDDYLVRRFAQA